MGGAYAKGFLKAVMEYIQKHPEECNGINLAEYDFAPYQPGSQTAIEGWIRISIHIRKIM